MLDVTTTPIARSITLKQDNHGQPIIEKMPPAGRIKVASFLQTVFPAQVVEHVGRASLVQLDRWKDTPAPSSLFFQTVHRAFADHHALGLRPEVLMYLVNAVVAETVRRHPEDYRDFFTSAAGKVDIHVIHDGLQLGNPESPWHEAIGTFHQALGEKVPSNIMGQMLPTFTTSDTEAQVASLVSFMDAATPYYDYHVHTRCGIPRVVLFGEAADYRQLVTAVTELSKVFSKHLTQYFHYLIPVLERIAKTAEGGEVNEKFWGSIYKQFDWSGGDFFSGWLSAFLWYVHKEDRQTRQNPLVEKDKKFANWKRIEKREGLNSGSEPTHVSRVPFTWHYLGTVVPMHFVGGILGIEVADQALTPVLSYGVLRA